jgi:hypothetical protein
MTVIQFGIPRTGSTLVYRVLQEIFGNVEKCHMSQVKPYLNKNINIVVSVRHPIDSFLSYIRVVDFPYASQKPDITMSLVKKYLPRRIEEHDQLTTILSRRNKNYTLVLKYERFYNDIKYMCDIICDFFNVQPTNIIDIIKTCNLESTVKLQETMSSFKEHDSRSNIHGNHIKTPEPHSIYEATNPNVIAYLENIFKKQIEEWDNL